MPHVPSLIRTGVLALVTLLDLAPLAVSPVLAAETRQYDAIGRLADVAYGGGASIHYTFDSNSNILSIVSSIAGTGVSGGGGGPLGFALGPATPNPGAGPRSIAFGIPLRCRVTLRVLDVSGREVVTLLDRALDPGRYTAQFSTARWSAGAYFYRIEAGGHTRSGRLTVLP